MADAAYLTDAELPEDYLVTTYLAVAGAAAVPAADLIEQRRHLRSLNPELFVHYLERFERV